MRAVKHIGNLRHLGYAAECASQSPVIGAMAQLAEVALDCRCRLQVQHNYWHFSTLHHRQDRR